MLGVGIIGYYLSKIYEEIKFRPRYIVNEEAGEGWHYRTLANPTQKTAKFYVKTAIAEKAIYKTSTRG